MGSMGGSFDRALGLTSKGAKMTGRGALKGGYYTIKGFTGLMLAMAVAGFYLFTNVYGAILTLFLWGFWRTNVA